MKPIPIPPRWTAEEALSVVGFLEQIIESIWSAHGYRMGEYLQARQEAINPLTPPYPADTDDDIYPF